MFPHCACYNCFTSSLIACTCIARGFWVSPMSRCYNRPVLWGVIFGNCDRPRYTESIQCSVESLFFFVDGSSGLLTGNWQKKRLFNNFPYAYKYNSIKKCFKLRYTWLICGNNSINNRRNFRVYIINNPLDPHNVVINCRLLLNRKRNSTQVSVLNF